MDHEAEPTELTDFVNLALHASNKNVESHFAENIIQCVSPTTFGSLYCQFPYKENVISKICNNIPTQLASESYYVIRIKKLV